MSWRDRMEGLVTADDARYALLFPIDEAGDKGKIYWFRTMEGLKEVLGDEEQQKALLPFRVIHAKELRERLAPIERARLKRTPCYDQAPDELRAEVFELREAQSKEEH